MFVSLINNYILSAIITSEFANTKYRGAMMAAVFAMQGFGILTAAIVVIILLSMFKSSVNANIDNLDYVWRLCIAFGTLPCLVAIYFRLSIPETPRYTMQVENNINKGVNDVRIKGVKNESIKWMNMYGRCIMYVLLYSSIPIS